MSVDLLFQFGPFCLFSLFLSTLSFICYVWNTAREFKLPLHCFVLLTVSNVTDTFRKPINLFSSLSHSPSLSWIHSHCSYLLIYAKRRPLHPSPSKINSCKKQHFDPAFRLLRRERLRGITVSPIKFLSLFLILHIITVPLNRCCLKFPQIKVCTYIINTLLLFISLQFTHLLNRPNLSI